ncbi:MULTISPECIES: TetR/AcrR family transcriptional regulator [Gordonia]|uniref:TetR/AcrR family transcriptional regulator n=1 Tax=Gordonia TaxID=2053 RepID=UPI0030C788BD
MTRAGRGNLREEQKRQTRAKLMASARALFAERGYAAVTIDDVAADVGCSRATFYLHFPGKLDILLALAQSGDTPSWLSFYEDLDHVLDGGSRDDFAGWVSRALDWFATNDELFRAWDEATALEPEFREIARAGIAALPDSMTRYLARWPDDRRDEARLRIELLVTQLERFFQRWDTLGTIDGSRELAVEVLTDVWHTALSAPDPTSHPAP